MHQFYSILKNGITLPSFEGAHDTSQYTLYTLYIILSLFVSLLNYPAALPGFAWAVLHLQSQWFLHPWPDAVILVEGTAMETCGPGAGRCTLWWILKAYIRKATIVGAACLLALIKLSYVSGSFFWKNNLSKPTPFQYLATWLLAFSGSPHAGVPAGGFWGCGYVRSAL